MGLFYGENGNPIDTGIMYGLDGRPSSNRQCKTTEDISSEGEGGTLQGQDGDNSIGRAPIFGRMTGNIFGEKK